jgi:hypothetical protein
MDLMYAIALRKLSRYAARNILPGQRLMISVDTAGHDYPEGSVYFGEAVVGRSSRLPVSLSNRYRYPKTFELLFDSIGAFGKFSNVARIDGSSDAVTSLRFSPLDTIDYSANLNLIVSDFNMPAPKVVLTGRGGLWPLEGDLYPNGALDIRDLAFFLRLLYGTPIETTEIAVTDLDNSGATSLDDFVILFNRIFLSAPNDSSR